VDTTWKTIVWRQFGAAIDMLRNAVLACPPEVWSDGSRQPEFWYLVYHTLFWLDLYLSGPVEGFAPPPPYTLSELDPAGPMPERVYTRDELLAYLRHGRRKCRETIDGMTDEAAAERLRFGWGEATRAELLLYNLRHVQHHTGQLNLILRQQTDSAPRWVARAADEPVRDSGQRD
jgi:hypothetical protein